MKTRMMVSSSWLSASSALLLLSMASLVGQAILGLIVFLGVHEVQSASIPTPVYTQAFTQSACALGTFEASDRSVLTSREGYAGVSLENNGTCVARMNGRFAYATPGVVRYFRPGLFAEDDALLVSGGGRATARPPLDAVVPQSYSGVVTEQGDASSFDFAMEAWFSYRLREGPGSSMTPQQVQVIAQSRSRDPLNAWPLLVLGRVNGAATASPYRTNDTLGFYISRSNTSAPHPSIRIIARAPFASSSGARIQVELSSEQTLRAFELDSAISGNSMEPASWNASASDRDREILVYAMLHVTESRAVLYVGEACSGVFTRTPADLITFPSASATASPRKVMVSPESRVPSILPDFAAQSLVGASTQRSTFDRVILYSFALWGPRQPFTFSTQASRGSVDLSELDALVETHAFKSLARFPQTTPVLVRETNFVFREAITQTERTLGFALDGTDSVSGFSVEALGPQEVYPTPPPTWTLVIDTLPKRGRLAIMSGSGSGAVVTSYVVNAGSVLTSSSTQGLSRLRYVPDALPSPSVSTLYSLPAQPLSSAIPYASSQQAADALNLASVTPFDTFKIRAYPNDATNGGGGGSGSAAVLSEPSLVRVHISDVWQPPGLDVSVVPNGILKAPVVPQGRTVVFEIPVWDPDDSTPITALGPSQSRLRVSPTTFAPNSAIVFVQGTSTQGIYGALYLATTSNGGTVLACSSVPVQSNQYISPVTFTNGTQKFAICFRSTSPTVLAGTGGGWGSDSFSFRVRDGSLLESTGNVGGAVNGAFTLETRTDNPLQGCAADQPEASCTAEGLENNMNVLLQQQQGSTATAQSQFAPVLLTGSDDSGVIRALSFRVVRLPRYGRLFRNIGTAAQPVRGEEITASNMATTTFSRHAPGTVNPSPQLLYEPRPHYFNRYRVMGSIASPPPAETTGVYSTNLLGALPDTVGAPHNGYYYANRRGLGLDGCAYARLERLLEDFASNGTAHGWNAEEDTHLGCRCNLNRYPGCPDSFGFMMIADSGSSLTYSSEATYSLYVNGQVSESLGLRTIVPSANPTQSPRAPPTLLVSPTRPTMLPSRFLDVLDPDDDTYPIMVRTVFQWSGGAAGRVGFRWPGEAGSPEEQAAQDAMYFPANQRRGMHCVLTGCRDPFIVATIPSYANELGLGSGRFFISINTDIDESAMLRVDARKPRSNGATIDRALAMADELASSSSSVIAVASIAVRNANSDSNASGLSGLGELTPAQIGAIAGGSIAGIVSLAVVFFAARFAIQRARMDAAGKALEGDDDNGNRERNAVMVHQNPDHHSSVDLEADSSPDSRYGEMPTKGRGGKSG